MRRSDRQVTDIDTIKSFIAEGDVCRVAIHDNEGLYIFPINYGYIFDSGKLAFYFHSAKEGRKVSAAKENCSAAFEIDCGYELIETEGSPCSYSCKFKSVVGTGTLSTVSDIEEKKRALSIIMENLSSKTFEFNDTAANSVEVLKLEADTFTAKAKL